MPQTLRGKFVRGPRILIDGLCREELANDETLKAYGITIKDWEFEAADLDAGAERALRNQRNYNGRTRDATQDAIRYIGLRDRRGQTRDLWHSQDCS